jgi:hypothetical protein
LNQEAIDGTTDDDEPAQSHRPADVAEALAGNARRAAKFRPESGDARAADQMRMDYLAEAQALGGVRLYDAMIRKCEATMQVQTPAFSMPLAELQRIRDEEARHADMLVQAIDMLGADPTAQTPGAVLVGMEAAGLMQVLNSITAGSSTRACLRRRLRRSCRNSKCW